LHIPFQGERVVAAPESDISVFEVIVDVLTCERVKRQDAITYLGLLFIREARHDEPVADVDAKLVTAYTPRCV
jgi:hypothetical protein